MHSVGIICEYNPFHNGHALHLREARARTGADFVVCVMSGHFTQRGEPACVNKWTRAKMALLSGADVVLELPTLFAVRPAEIFARGGVTLLATLGVEALAFGAEQADLTALQAAAAKLAEEDSAFQQTLRDGLKQGQSHARARSAALGNTGLKHIDIAQPNNALALCYLQAIAAQGYPLQPVAIAREGGGYHEAALSPLASATAVRTAMAAGQWDELAQALPESALGLLLQARAGGRLARPDALDTALLSRLRTLPLETIAALADVSEGLENRLQKAAWATGTRAALLAHAKCKRYTYARLSRIALAALLDLPQALAAAQPLPTYARLLGAKKSATPLLRRWQQQAALPLITRVTDPRVAKNPALALDIRATDLWTLALADPAQRAARLDFTTAPVIVE